MVRSASKRRSRNFYMSVVVIDGNMPTDYDSCWYLDCKCWKECSVNGKQYNCPLRPLPEKHGGLIDVDALKKTFRDAMDNCEGDFKRKEDAEEVRQWVELLCRDFDAQPIIVEAKGE